MEWAESLTLFLCCKKARWCFCQFPSCQAGLKQLPSSHCQSFVPGPKGKLKSPFQQSANCWDVAISVLCPLLRGGVTRQLGPELGWAVQPAGPCSKGLFSTGREEALKHEGTLICLLLSWSQECPRLLLVLPSSTRASGSSMGAGMRFWGSLFTEHFSKSFALCWRLCLCSVVAGSALAFSWLSGESYCLTS